MAALSHNCKAIMSMPIKLQWWCWKVLADTFILSSQSRSQNFTMFNINAELNFPQFRQQQAAMVIIMLMNAGAHSRFLLCVLGTCLAGFGSG